MSTPPRPHPFACSRAAAFARRAIAATWDKGLTEKPPLDPDHLWKVGARGFDEADERSIRAPEDVADFRERLESLCRSLREEAALNPLGHAMAYGQITSAIRKRHALGRYWNRNPAAAAAEIAAPILVVGQMRSGTTRVQRLLAADPRHAGTRFCDSHDPVPRSPDLRPLRARAALALARRINPWLDTMHPFGAARTDEEIGWLATSLSPATFEAQWRIPSFLGDSLTRDHTPLYREFARILRTDAHARGNADRPRVLKCPQFTEDLSPLLAQFPDARIVLCTRAEDEVLSSSISMTASQMAFQTDTRDLAALTRTWEGRIAMRETAMRQALTHFDGPLAEVGFAALNANWRASIAQVYRSLGLVITPAALDAMAREYSEMRRDAHGGHAAQIEQFASPASA